MAGNLFGPSTATGFNVTDAYIPRGGMQTGLFDPAPLTNNFEPYSLTYDNTTAGFNVTDAYIPQGDNTTAGFNVPDYVPQGGTQTGLFAPAPLTNTFEPYSLTYDNTTAGFLNSNLGFPTNTTVGYPCLAGPAF